MTVVEQVEKLVEDKERLSYGVLQHGWTVHGGIEQGEPQVRVDEVESMLRL